MDLTFGLDLPDDQYNNLKDLTITIRSVQKDSFGTVYTTKLGQKFIIFRKTYDYLAQLLRRPRVSYGKDRTSPTRLSLDLMYDYS